MSYPITWLNDFNEYY